MPTKDKNKDKIVTISSPKGEITLFESSKEVISGLDLPKGVDQLTPVQFKWEEQGQHIAGQYCGHTKLESSFKEQGFFHFHEIRLFNGVMVGFIGSTQLDRALTRLEPFEKDVHIIFVDEKELPGKKTFKAFQIFVRDHNQAPTQAPTQQQVKTPF